MYYSPLRYPGGKGKLAPFMELMIDKLQIKGGTYIEPFAGGAGVALELLLNNVVGQIVINDLDKGIYSFWKAILNETQRFIDAIDKVPLTVDEWIKQKKIIEKKEKYSFELGFATFYLNRTNRSGIIKGGLIGGTEQKGDWKLDARFNKAELIRRIEVISKRKKDIHIYNKDVISLITKYVDKYGDNTLIYFDPPYFEKGKQLYMNYFSIEDHERIKEMIQCHVRCNWIITYDDAPEIVDIYTGHNIKRFDLNYSVSKKRVASEIIIFPERLVWPTKDEMEEKGVKINLR